MANYPKILPRDAGGQPMQEYPAATTANARYNNQNLAVSSLINLHPATSSIEVTAFSNGGAVIRWIPLTETAAVSPFASAIASGAGINYDHAVPPSTTRRFVVPKETQGSPTGQMGSINGLYQRLAVVNTGGATSVLVSEY